MGTESQPDGKELFRELLSLFPSAFLEDYYKNGVWQIELMEIDKELIEAHRNEAGAPEPTPLDEVVMPEIPTRPAAPAPGSLALRPGIKPFVTPSNLAMPAPVGIQRIAPAAKPGQAASFALKKPLIKPSAPKAPGAIGFATSAASTASASGTAGAASAELRQIALFIQRWKLPATQTKLLLARVNPARRKWVMANYKGSGPLEQYIQQCERTNSWAAAGSATPAAAAKPGLAKPAPAKPGMAFGVKRPFGMLTPSTGSSAFDAAKRARMTYGTGASGAAQAAKGGPKQPASAPPAGSLLRGTAAARLGGAPGPKPGSWAASSASTGAGPSWAARPGSYGGASSLAKPAAKLGAAAKPGGGWGSGGMAPARPAGAIGLIKPGAKPAAAKPFGAKPFAAAKPAMAKPGMGLMRPAAKPAAAKAVGAGKPGSLIRSLLKSA